MCIRDRHQDLDHRDPAGVEQSILGGGGHEPLEDLGLVRGQQHRQHRHDDKGHSFRPAHPLDRGERPPPAPEIATHPGQQHDNQDDGHAHRRCRGQRRHHPEPVSYTHLDVYKRQLYIRHMFEYYEGVTICLLYTSRCV